MPPTTGHETRLASRNGTWTKPTCSIALGYLQANLIVLPSTYAHDFELLCARNPVPCPLLAKSAATGNFQNLVSCIPSISERRIAENIDLRTDAPKYNVYVDGALREQGASDVVQHWNTKDHVAFLIGCSYSFETALAEAGLTPPHNLHGRNVAMYRTRLPLCPAGKFQGGTYVVSLRMYKKEEIERVRDITRPYVVTHGEPIAWGWDGVAALGIDNIAKPDWGDPPVLADGQLAEHGIDDAINSEVPVVWGCGVTPQEAVMRARVPGVVLGHAPGHMIVLDLQEEDLVNKQ